MAMTPATQTLPIASARMYSWSPSLTAAWRRLLEWVSGRAFAPHASPRLAFPGFVR
jgi:hypothetical protein